MSTYTVESYLVFKRKELLHPIGINSFSFAVSKQCLLNFIKIKLKFIV